MDIILYNIIIGFCCFIFGYFFGSIPMGVIVGKLFFHKDPREAGSKNSGGTNVGRLFGKKAGLIVIFLDMIKTVLPLIAVFLIFKYSPLKQEFASKLGAEIWDDGIFYIYLAPLGAAIGHCYPIFAGFKGGKAVATFGGIGLSTSWFMSLFGFGAFMITLKSTKYVSLSSIVAAITSIITSWLMFVLRYFLPNGYENIGMWGNGTYLLSGWEYATVITIIAVLLIVRHSANIKRLINKQESKIKWMK